MRPTVIDRKDENLSSPHAHAHLARHFDGADEGQQVVDHGNVRLGFEGFDDRLFPIGGFGDDLPVRAGFQHFPQRGSDHLTFIGNENAGHSTDTFTHRLELSADRWWIGIGRFSDGNGR
jgi:hypothetical protein